MDNHLLLVNPLGGGGIGNFGVRAAASGAAAGRAGINKGGGFGNPNAFANSSFPRRSKGPQRYSTVFMRSKRERLTLTKKRAL